MADTDQIEEPTSGEQKKVNFAEELALQQQRYRNSIAELETALQARMKPPQADPNELLWRISSALVAPSKTGSFAESIGNVAGTIAKYREDERARALQQQNQAAELAKMKMEVSKGLLGETESQAVQQLTPRLYTVNKETGLPEVNIEVAQQLAGITKDPKYIEAINKQVQRNQAIKLFAGSTGAVPGQSVDASQASRLTPQLITKIKLADKEVGEIAENEFKNFLSNVTSQVEQSKLQATVTGLVAQYGPDILPYLPPGVSGLTRAIPPVAEAPGAQTPGKPGQPPAAAAPTESSGLSIGERQKARGAGAAKLEEGKAERTNGFIESSSGAGNRIDAGRAMIGLASSNPNAFGVLQKPGVGPAILGFLSEGVQAGGFGSVGFKGIEDALRKAGDRSYSNLPPAEREKAIQSDINAARMFATYASRVELEAAKTFFKGQGAVTENERKIVREMGANISDPAKVIIAKSQMLMLQANKEQELRQAFDNSGAQYFDDFQKSQAFKDITSKYEKLANGLRDRFIGKSKPISSKLDAELQRRGQP